MSILIKDMEMPKHCNDCELSARVNLEYGYGYCCQILMEMISNTHERKTNCPLIEIPDGHGRLIDADALMNDGWTLHKQVMRMGGYAIHEMPLNNPNVPIVIPADKDGKDGG